MMLWRLFDLPNPNEMYDHVVRLFREHGAVIVFMSALVEGLVLINLYFPGSAVILLGVAAARGSPLQAAMVVLVASIAFVLSGCINYAIGRTGLYWLVNRLGGTSWLLKAQQTYRRHGAVIIPVAYVHPNLGAFISVSAGVSRLAFGRFALLCLVGVACWNALWGVIAYLFASTVAQLATQPMLLLCLLITWTTIAFLSGLLRNVTEM